VERHTTGMSAKPSEAKIKRQTDARTETAKAKLRSAGANIDAAIQRPLEAIQHPFSFAGQHPLESLGVALALGMIVGRSPNLMRNVAGIVAGTDGKNAQALMQTLVDAFTKR
jgi:ElaB/YqjD/DUF883 family membrane-anchored ribosome-binding protein